MKMEFADGKCPECGKKLGNRKPKDVVELDEPYTTMKRYVSFVAPCPFCGENIPLWAGPGPGLEPSKPEPEPVPEPEPEPAPEPEE